MTMTRIQAGGLQVAGVLHDFVQHRAAPGTGITPEAIWAGLAQLVTEFGPKNAALLKQRDDLQAKLDTWHQANCGRPVTAEAQREFLNEIGYLVPEGENFHIATANVDAEIAEIAGPQLVVPVNNARYALNAANARWGSLYDALYGTNAISEEGGCARGDTYNPARGAKVMAWAREFLDQAVPLAQGSHKTTIAYSVLEGKFAIELAGGFLIQSLADPTQLAAFSGNPASPKIVLLRNHGLHIEIQIDRSHSIGQIESRRA